VELDIDEPLRLDTRAPIADQRRVAIESDDVTGPSSQEQREPSPAAAEIEDTLALEILAGEQGQESRADAGGLRHVHRASGRRLPASGGARLSRP
jgi:hypothetical protein